MSHYDYAREHIFRPTGMTNTDTLPETVEVPERSTGYMRQDSGWKSNVDWLPYRGMAAGGGYSTVGDLLKFANALQMGKLLPRSLFADATKPQNHERWYGYGFQVQGEGEFINFGHDGGAPGMNAEIRIFPKLDIVVIALSNLDPPAAERLAEFYLWRTPGTH